MGLLKKIGIGLLALIVLGMIFGGNSDKPSAPNLLNNTKASTQTTSPSTTQPATSSVETSPSSTTSSSVTIDLAQYMPTRDEIDTTWSIYTKNVDEMDLLRDDVKARAIGLKEARITEIERDEGRDHMDDGAIELYLFDSVINAKNYYNSEVSATKDEGGYEEQSTSGVNTECFAARFGNRYDGFNTWMACTKKNIFFMVEISSFNQYKMGDYKSLGKTIADKIK